MLTFSVLISVLPILLTVAVRVLYPGFNHLSTFAVILGVICILARLAMRSKDPYGLFHLSLNKMPGEVHEADPLTEWLNMGYWKVGIRHSYLFSFD